MTDIKDSIMRKLKETESNYNVKIPLAIESGSRGWGFASPDSDYDCRFVYVHPKDWYLSILDKKDFIEYAADAVFDLNEWDLKKVLTHIMKSNAVMFEWLSSNDIYIKNEAVVKQLQGLADIFFNPLAVSYHYLSIAKNKLAEIQAEADAKLKKYFYVLRPVANLQFIRQHSKMPYMEYDRTLSEIELPAGIAASIREMKEVKLQSDESFRIPRNTRLIEYVQNEIEFYTEHLKEIKFQKPREYEMVDAVFKNIIEDVWLNE